MLVNALNNVNKRDLIIKCSIRDETCQFQAIKVSFHISHNNEDDNEKFNYTKLCGRIQVLFLMKLGDACEGLEHCLFVFVRNGWGLQV